MPLWGALIPIGIGLGKKLLGGGGKKDKGPSQSDRYRRQSEEYAGRVAGLGPRIQQYGRQFQGAGRGATRAAGRLSSFDPFAGLDQEVAAFTKRLTPGFEEQMQALRERASSRGAFRGGQAVFEENRAQTGFEETIADFMSQRLTQRAGLDLRGRESAFTAQAGLSDRFAGGIGMESDLYSGMSDYYARLMQAEEDRKGEKRSGYLGLAGDLLGAAGNVAGSYLSRAA